MKKFILMVVLAVASVMMIYAQPRAIGGRLGAFNGISYQHGFGDKNMLEVELGWSVDGRTDFWRNVGGVQTHGRTWGTTVQAAATYDWIDPFNAPVPWNEQGEWHWYGNVGNAWNWGYIGAAGRIGIEYDFWFPLQLSLDWRPTLGAGLFDDQNGGAEAGLYWEMSCISLGVRYKF